MRTILLATLTCCVAAMSALATGETEQTGSATSAGTTQPMSGTGMVATYATPTDYQRATGNTVGELQEAPMLATLVASGELPAVAERLPNEPLVVVPAQEIGTYGGTMRSSREGGVSFDAEDILREFPLTYTNDFSAVVPNVYRSFSVSPDGRTYTFRLREGLRWSDGQPFTTADVMFYYESVASNRDLYPSGVADNRIAGQDGIWRRVDDFTFNMSFAAPYGVLDEKLARWRVPGEPYAPRHYLTQFHPEHTRRADVDAEVQAAGFDSWTDLFFQRIHWYTNPESPAITAWLPETQATGQIQTFVRNPYYWKVDAAGNQLPYIDRWNREFVSDREAILLKFLAGDMDWALGNDDLDNPANYALVKREEQRGRFVMTTTEGWPTLTGAIFFNYTHDNPEIAELFRNKDFRIAISHAIDREEINDVIWNGGFWVRQVTLPKNLYKAGERDNPKYLQYIDYDIAKSNEILDRLGLKWNAGRTLRTFPSGRPLQFNVIVQSPTLSQVEMTEMVKQYWTEIGIDINIRPVGGGLRNEMMMAGNYDMMVRNNTFGGRPIIGPLRCSAVPICTGWMIAPKWGAYVWTNGAQGEQAPEPFRGHIQRLFELHQAYLAETDPARRQQIDYEIMDIHAEGLMYVGVLDRPYNSPAAWNAGYSSRLRNYSEPGSPEWPYAVTSSWYLRQ